MPLNTPPINDSTAYYSLNQRIDKFEERVWTALNDLIKSNAELTATIKHPDPSHCTKTTTVQNISDQLQKIEIKLNTLELDKATIQGGGKVAQWVFNLLIALVGLLIGFLAKFKGVIP